MSGNKDGGAAFPVEELRVQPGGHDIYQHAETGMSMRDYFAAQALGGLCAAMPSGAFTDSINGVRGGKGLSAAAYSFADAMLAERAKGGAP